MKYLEHYQYPFENDYCDRLADATQQFKRSAPFMQRSISLNKHLLQMARTPNTISGPESDNGLNNILYLLDGLGNIDFSNPQQYNIGNAYPGLNPVTPGSQVDITTAVNTYGTTNRYQHFKEANSLDPAFGGKNGCSPGGLT